MSIHVALIGLGLGVVVELNELPKPNEVITVPREQVVLGLHKEGEWVPEITIADELGKIPAFADGAEPLPAYSIR